MAEKNNSRTQSTVDHVDGKVWVRTPDGRLHALKAGDHVEAGQVIVTGANSHVALHQGSGNQLNIGPDRTVILDQDVLSNSSPDKTEAAIKPLDSDASQIIAALNSGADPLAALAPTAAGVAGGGADNGHSFVRLLRVVEDVTPQSFGTPSDAPSADAGQTIGGEDRAQVPAETPAPIVVSEVSAARTTEGGNLDFTVTLSQSASTPTTVSLTPNSGTATIGTDTSSSLLVSFDGGSSFTTVTGGSVVVPVGSSSFIVRLPTTDDNISELTETVTLTAGTPANTTPLTGTGTIDDNDVTTITVSGPPDVNEAIGTATYTVTLSTPSALPVTVSYNTSNGTATSGSDFTTSTGTLTFAPGETSKTITVPITNDTVYEGPETFTVNLTTPTNATIGTPTTTVTIHDDGTGTVPPGTTPDDDRPAVGTVSSPSVLEGGNLDFTITLTHASTTATTVTLVPASGTATLGTDTTGSVLVSFDGGSSFTSVTGSTVSVPAGATSFVVRVPTVDDVISESTETITLGASTPINTSAVVGTGSILDNDSSTLSISGPSDVNEAATAVTYTVTLSTPSSSAVTVNYSTANGTATAGADYTANSGTLTFAPGETSKTITVAILNDTVYEGAETFSVNLS
ncbi:retention module-containing protein, partial [Uliginosibacterium sediminicola]